ncbi:site-specific tyrosine recombinase/integron integrase [Vallitalea guaymasensis]|uniref:site-specific tyrosine recombinase/integron integrase n=1 Tax=Vallitalea guaymasensis TaxID=1185412 RepID=UPI000DE2D1F3|nr:site-specific tyrosine recombinase/integron integrase [Vallitalea guaymasensis]
MNSQKLNNEVVIRIVDQILKIEPLVNTVILKDAIEVVLNDYELASKKYEVTTTDIPDMIYYFLATKKLEGLSMKTLKNYKYILDLFAQSHYRIISSITEIDIKMYLATLMDGKASSTYETYIACLKTFFSWLYDQEYIHKNPMKNIKYPKRDKNLRNPLKLEEIEVLRDACLTLRERAIFEFLLATGCRVDEVVGLKISDIDWSRLQLKVVGKGRKERICYFTDKAKYHLQKYLLSRIDQIDYLFISTRKPYSYLKIRAIEKEITTIGERVNIKVFPHLLRHTFATVLLQSGAKLEVVQELLGHESPKTTQVYAKLNTNIIHNQYKLHMIA